MKYRNLSKQELNAIPFQTGDIILFEAKGGLLTSCIKCCSHSKFNHIGMVIKDPKFKDFNKEGLFLIESTTLDSLPDVEEHKVKVGVQLHDLHNIIKKYPGKAYWRSLDCDRTGFGDKMAKLHAIVHNEPYDLSLMDWAEIIFHKYAKDMQRTDTFICSALVGFLWVGLGVLDSDTPWTVLRPVDFSENPVYKYPMKYLNDAYLGDVVRISTK